MFTYIRRRRWFRIRKLKIKETQIIDGLKPTPHSLKQDTIPHAEQILAQAISMKKEGFLQKSLDLYQEGIAILLSVLKNETNRKRKEELRELVDNYLKDAEEISKFLNEEQNTSHSTSFSSTSSPLRSKREDENLQNTTSYGLSPPTNYENETEEQNSGFFFKNYFSLILLKKPF